MFHRLVEPPAVCGLADSPVMELQQVQVARGKLWSPRAHSSACKRARAGRLLAVVGFLSIDSFAVWPLPTQDQ